jgi:hypothetical protein
MNKSFTLVLKKKRMTMRMNLMTHKFVSIVNSLLGLGLLVSSLLTLIMLIIGREQLDVVGVCVEFNKVIKFEAFILPLSIASIQLSRHIAQTSIASIISLRNALNEDSMKRVQDMHMGSNGECENVLDIELLNFLGYLEIGSIMLQKGLIKEDEFINQFKAILQWVITTPNTYQHIALHINYYKDLLFVIYMFEPESYAELCHDAHDIVYQKSLD